MKVVAFVGSPKAEGNTYQSMKMVGNVLEQSNIEVEYINVGSKRISGCIGCGGCFKKRDERCVFTDGDDIVNTSIQKIKEADGLLIGSPVYYAGVAGSMKCFLDRIFYVAGANGGLFRHKVGASVVAVRRSGGLPTFHELNNYLTYAEMLIPTSNYWNVVHGTMPGEVFKDTEGVQIMETLGANMVWLMNLVENGKGKVEEPKPVKKVFMNFIRNVD